MLRILFTVAGILLLLGTIITNEWASAEERLSYLGIAICILVVCQPSASFRFLRWLWKGITSLFRTLLHSFAGNTPSKSDESRDNPSTEGDYCNKNLNKPLLSTQKAKINRVVSDSYEYRHPAEISQNNIVPISDTDMAVLLRHYRKVDEIKTKVKGVSYRNGDGTDRQNILAHCHAGDQLRFKPYIYKGSPAYAVYCDWGQIGNLSAELAEEIAEEIASRKNPCLILGEILNVSGGYHGEYFGCNICVSIYEKL